MYLNVTGAFPVVSGFRGQYSIAGLLKKRCNFADKEI